MEDKSISVLRKIIHIDMDAFYASVEQRDFPEFRGKPLVVGGNPDSRGVVATASYEARSFGIKSAMPCIKAYQLCPHAIFVYPRFDAYIEVSKKLREIFSRYTDLIEPLSLDEAYLDVTDDKKNIGSAIEIAKAIKEDIRNELNLTATAGISINKFVAKVASDMNKPDGITFIGPSKINAFMEKLAVEKFYGIGKVTATKMKSMQVKTGADLKKLSEEQLIAIFGKSGKFFYTIVRGIDNRQVQSQRLSKSVGAEDTLREDSNDLEYLKEILKPLAETISKRLIKKNLKGKTLTLKIKYSDFKLTTKSKTFNFYLSENQEIYKEGLVLLKENYQTSQSVRLLGLTVSNFYEDFHLENQNDLQLELDL